MLPASSAECGQCRADKQERSSCCQLVSDSSWQKYVYEYELKAAYTDKVLTFD